MGEEIEIDMNTDPETLKGREFTEVLIREVEPYPPAMQEFYKDMLERYKE